MSLSLSSLSQLFWSESVWTPPNATWELYEIKGYRHYNDIYYSFITAFFLIIIRFTLERFIYSPIGISLGLRPGHPKPPFYNSILENAYKQSKGKLNDKQIKGLSKQTDLSERQIQRWLRVKSFQNRPTILTKFTESAWRCNFYLFAFIFGTFVLWDKPWMSDSIYCFKDYPHHYVSSEEWWYYNIESGFYLGLIFSQFFDTQRKDFWAMFLHHIVTLCLLVFSWACNLVRIGTLVLIIHDFADVPLEFAKMMMYVKKQRIADLTFVVFTLSWVVSRLGLLPYRIIYFSSYRALEVVEMFSAYYIFNGLLCALQLLHIVWTFFIIKILFYAIKNNGIKDLRSDDEEEQEDEDDNDDKIIKDGMIKDGNMIINNFHANGGGDRKRSPHKSKNHS